MVVWVCRARPDSALYVMLLRVSDFGFSTAIGGCTNLQVDVNNCGAVAQLRSHSNGDATSCVALTYSIVVNNCGSLGNSCSTLGLVQQGEVLGIVLEPFGAGSALGPQLGNLSGVLRTDGTERDRTRTVHERTDG
ncbi:BQ2448_599 [Microbotryum intermedium]|uniref:BQ2448_599 protein n=1 Tax=Microbotryum intermedium TaxID=269621 RepID=A0A238FBG2_9BASI|nr:BQ2448_599 [Microbotryum intermedium]